LDRQIIVFHNERKRIITDCDSHFVIEGKSQYLKWSLDDSYVEFQYGPKLKLGADFYDQGQIEKIEETLPKQDEENKAVKVIVKRKENKNEY
jgi:hypothetical protein